ncbi:MAG: YgiT-type zinc finger protein [Firmicutes bacterium]|nr:YgiT-type zinc finger protein [Bacillota bacterium]
MISGCHVCGGSVTKQRVSVQNWWGDSFTIVDGVPAFACADCGEQYFDAETSLQLDRMRKKMGSLTPKKIIEVPVYEFPAMASRS